MVKTIKSASLPVSKLAKLIPLLCFPLTVIACQQQPVELNGKVLYETKCAKCHGSDGTKGQYGAKNLRKSRLNDDDLFNAIGNGSWIMPKWKKKLTREQLLSVTAYVKTLRN
jgi:cytochrome c6